MVYYCVGFTGRRLDHFLSVCSNLVKYHLKKVVLVGTYDLICHVPNIFEINLPLGTRISLFPMQPVVGLDHSGLKWSISGVKFEPAKLVGTSNISVERKVKIVLSNDCPAKNAPDGWEETAGTVCMFGSAMCLIGV